MNLNRAGSGFALDFDRFDWAGRGPGGRAAARVVVLEPCAHGAALSDGRRGVTRL